MKNIILIALTIIILIGCKKQPTADFTIDKHDYSASENVVITNYSEDAVKCIWTITDPVGQSTEIVDKHPVYKVPTLGKDGIYTIALKTLSKRDKKTATMSRDILVNTIRGNLTVNFEDGAKLTVTVDNELVNSEPSRYINVDISLGPHYLTATDGSRTWTFTMVIAAGYNQWSIIR